MLSSKSRVLTYNSNGDIISEEESTQSNKYNGVDMNNVKIDGIIFVSTNAAAKITERAAGIAFDKWAAEILKDAPPQSSEKGSEGDNNAPDIERRNDTEDTGKALNPDNSKTQEETKVSVTGLRMSDQANSTKSESGNEQKSSENEDVGFGLE